MIAADPYLVVRASFDLRHRRADNRRVALFEKALGEKRIWIGDPFSPERIVAFAWNLPVLLLVDVAARRFGWWLDAQGGLLLGFGRFSARMDMAVECRSIAGV